MPSVCLLEDRPRDQRLWSEYVERHPGSTLDHCWEWRWILKEAFGFKPYFLGVVDADRLTGLLPLFLVPRGLGRSALVSIPFGNYGGILSDSLPVTEALLDRTRQLMNDLRCSHVALHHREPVAGEGLTAQGDKARYYLPINGSLEEIAKELKQTVRKKVRYSEKHGLSVVPSRDTGPLYAIHVDKFRRLGSPCFPRAYFDLTLQHFGERVRIHYAHYQDRIIAFNFVIIFRRTLVVTVGGDLEPYLQLHPNYYLVWHEIRTAAQEGFTEVDMCRSTRNSGPAQFKLFLGMTETPLGYQYLCAGNQAVALRSPRDTRFQLAGRIWRRIPLSWTMALGPKLVRYFA